MTDMNDPVEPAVDNVEKALRQALRSVDPPPGFADRVIQRAARGTVRGSVGGRVWLGWATAAALVVGVSGGLWYRAEERRAQGEEARRQVLLSLRIAGAKLHEVQVKINHQGESQQ